MTKAAYTGPIVNKSPGRKDGLKVTVPKGSYILPADFVAALGQGNSLAGHMKIKEMYGRKSGQVFHGVPMNTINVSGGEDVLSPLEVERSGGPEKLDESVKQVRGNWIQQLQGMHGPQKGGTSFDDGGEDSGDDEDSSDDSSGYDDTGESDHDGIDAEGNAIDANQDGINDVTGDPVGSAGYDNAYDANAQATSVDQVAQEALDLLTQADALYQQDPLNVQEVQSVPDYYTWTDPTANVSNPAQAPDIQGGIISGPNGPESIIGWENPPGPQTTPDTTQPGFNELTGWGTIYDPDFYSPTTNNPVAVDPLAVSPQTSPDVTNPTTPDVTSPGPGVTPDVTSPGPTSPSTSPDVSPSPVDTTGPVDVSGFLGSGEGIQELPRRSGFFKGGYIDYTVKKKGNVKDRPKKKKRNGLKINNSSSSSSA